MLLLDAFNKDRASLPQPLPNPPPLAPIPVAAPDPRTQEMINEKLKKAEDLGEQGKVDEAQKALEEAEALKKLPTRQEPVVDNSNSSKYTAADVRITDQKLRVCDICGAFFSVYDRPLNYSNLLNMYGSWGVCFTYATWFRINELIASGKSYSDSPAICKACEFLMELLLSPISKVLDMV
ncbi:Cycloartenol synthase [Arachis hypogaea]|nr:Cycloartenol synthase [Arachis hypogaea]